MKVDKPRYKELSAAFCLVEAELFRKKELTFKENAYFDIVDRNGNGHLSPDEYKELVESMTDEDIQAAFDLLDTDQL